MASVNTDIAQTLDITCRRGDTFSLTINFKQSDGTSAVDLSNYSFEMEVRSSADDDGDSPVINKSDISISITNATGGTISIGVTDTVMETVEGDTYVYDIQAITADAGATTTWVTGSFTVNEDITI